MNNSHEISNRDNFQKYLNHLLQITDGSNLVNSKSLGLEVLFQISSSSNYMEVYIKIYNPQNDIIIISFLLNIFFGWVKKMSHREVSFMHPNHTLL